MHKNGYCCALPERKRRRVKKLKECFKGKTPLDKAVHSLLTAVPVSMSVPGGILLAEVLT